MTLPDLEKKFGVSQYMISRWKSELSKNASQTFGASGNEESHQRELDIPPIYVDVPEHPGHKVIVFHFDGWKWGDRPYTYRGRPYYKLESTTKIMPRDMYEDRLRAYEPQSYAWETFPAKGVSLSDQPDHRNRNTF